ncbi:class I SAM-dependent methyltransferase [Acinetobacter lwoffii]|uniref:class I SAM-dependent methyltransferase n=1 Tax=Acinetobacter lwoffii TaxID=28090 RepID=UPI00209B8378|nr:class I SAM-dependent methyltransferase [Acinetobacter lwoffii]MCO8073588.1 class I SAM-dependent methyltransferase [Acinetobacter lwoffii]MCO8076586.1 class I SAM-dependent methyltransferase [Acinetobacter lwoffii]
MAKNFHSEVVVASYDDHIRKLIPGYELVHQQIEAILSTELPETAHILVVGCGTGYELSYLLQRYPDWTFTAIDLSAAMLEQASKNLNSIDRQRVKFIQSTIQELHHPDTFDAALAILVAHFIPNSEKNRFFQAIHQCLKTNSLALTYDLMQPEDQQDIKIMQKLVQQTGLSVVQSTKMIERLEQDFHLLSTQNFTALLTKVEFKQCKIYCQIMNYHGFLLRK